MPISAAIRTQVLSIGVLAVLLAVIMTGLKIWAAWSTGSVAILSSLFDSAIDILISLMTWVSLTYSVRPPDEDHRYGHGKIEGVTSLVQAGLLGAGAAWLVYESLTRLVVPEPLENMSIGIGVMTTTTLLSLFLVWMQTRAIRASGSLAITADRSHYSADILTNLATLVALILIPATGWLWIDALFALMIGVIMAQMALRITRQSLNMLLDREVEAELKHRIAHLILADPQILRLHDLRVIRSGMRLMITYDIEMPGHISLDAAHQIAVASEDRVIQEFPQAEIMVHMDPEGVDHPRRHHIMDIIANPHGGHGHAHGAGHHH